MILHSLRKLRTFKETVATVGSRTGFSIVKNRAISASKDYGVLRRRILRVEHVEADPVLDSPEKQYALAWKWNGMGGRMATKAREVGTKKAAKGKQGATSTKKATGGKRASKAKTGKAEPGADDKKRLGEVAFDLMGDRAWSIALCLLEKTRSGNLKSAEMLQGLASRQSDVNDALEHGPLRSQALAWAEEPPWRDEVDLKQAEMESGSQEVE